MKTLAGFLVSLALLVSVDIAYSASPKQIKSPECRDFFQKWSRLPVGAFAISRDGRACGSSYGYQTEAEANKSAISACAERGRGCFVLNRTGLATAPRSKECRERLADWKKEDDVFRAFAVSGDGQACGWNRNSATLSEAEKGAIDGCSKYRKGCRVVETHQPIEIVKERQRQLQSLGYYGGEIDGEWGSGARRALADFRRNLGAEELAERDVFDLLRRSAGAASSASSSAHRGEANSSPPAADRIVSEGETGCSYVRYVKRLLRDLEMLSGEADCRMDNRWTESVERFQQTAGFRGPLNLKQIFHLLLTSDVKKSTNISIQDSTKEAGIVIDGMIQYEKAKNLIKQRKFSDAEAAIFPLYYKLSNLNLINSIVMARVMLILSETYEFRRYTDKAVSMKEQVIFVYENNFDAIEAGLLDINEVLDSVVSLSKLYTIMGDHVAAETIILRGIHIYNKYTQADIYRSNVLSTLYKKALRAKTMLNIILGRSYLKQKRLSDAESALEVAYDDTKRKIGLDTDLLVDIRTSLSSVYRSIGRHIEAMDLSRENFDMTKEKYGSTSLRHLEAIVNLSTFYIEERKYSEANQMLNGAIDIYSNYYNHSHPGEIVAREKIASLYIKRGQFSKAERELSYMLRLDKRIFLVDSPYRSIIMSRLASAFWLQGKNADALRYWETVLDNADPRLSSVMESTDDRFQNLVNMLRMFLDAVYKSDDLPTEERARISFLGQGWLKFGQFDVTLSDLGARIAAKNVGEAKLIRQLQELRDKRLSMLTAFAETFDVADVRETRRRDMSAEIALVGNEIESLNDRIRREFPNKSELTLQLPLKAEEAQALLAPGEGLVAYGEVDASVQYAWLVTKDRLEFTRLTAPTKVRQLVDDLADSVDLTKVASNVKVEARCAITSTMPGMEGRDFDACKSKELYNLVLGGFDLTGLDQLIIVPDGPLETIPFSMLVTGFHADGRPKWLIEDYAISMLPTTSSLRALRQTKARMSDIAQKPYLGVAPITFGKLNVASPVRSVLEDLPGTENEVRFLSGLLGGGTEGYVTGKAASEDFIKTATLDQYRVLSFATHGLMSMQSVDLTGGKISEPALVLAASEGEDGLLTATEAAGLRLDADWVLLSGCNTAAGDEDGAEGLSGIARAFFFAGARALLVSHWSIDDNAAMDVMVETMKRAAIDKTLGKAQALRQAMLTVMQKPGYNHPFFWAPFSLIGVENDIVGKRAASAPEPPSGRKLTNAEQSQIKALLGVAKKTTERGELDGAASDYASSRKAKDAKSGRPINVEPAESGTAKPATTTENAQACCSFDLASLKQKLAGCWSIPPGGSGQRKAIFVYVALSKSGELVAEPRVDADLMTGPDRVLAQSAIRAVKKCAPYSLPEAHYDEWKNMRINFETQTMQ